MDDNQTYLQRKHARFNTSLDLIKRVVKKASGHYLVNIKKIVVGEVNEVYEVENSNGQSLIIRISHGNSRFESEKWAIKKCRLKEIPVPEILFIEKILDGKEFLVLCIEKKIEGKPLNLIYTQLDNSNKQKLINDAGKILGKIHSVETGGFGELNKNGIGNENSWKEFMLKRDMERLSEVAKNVNLNIGLILKTQEEICGADEVYKDIKTTLIHGDFNLKHIIVNNNEIAGILDFENCKSGDPAWDFAKWDIFNKEIPMDWLKESYSNKNLFGINFNIRLRLAKLTICLRLLNYYANENNFSGLNLIKKELVQMNNLPRPF